MVFQEISRSRCPVRDSLSLSKLQADELRDKAPLVSEKPLSPAEVLQVRDSCPPHSHTMTSLALHKTSSSHNLLIPHTATRYELGERLMALLNKALRSQFGSEEGEQSKFSAETVRDERWRLVVE